MNARLLAGLFIAASLTAAHAQQAQPQQRPTATQILAQQIAGVLVQNAELIERNAALEERVAALTKQIAEQGAKKPD